MEISIGVDNNCCQTFEFCPINCCLPRKFQRLSKLNSFPKLQPVEVKTRVVGHRKAQEHAKNKLKKSPRKMHSNEMKRLHHAYDDEPCTTENCPISEPCTAATCPRLIKKYQKSDDEKMAKRDGKITNREKYQSNNRKTTNMPTENFPNIEPCTLTTCPKLSKKYQSNNGKIANRNTAADSSPKLPKSPKLLKSPELPKSKREKRRQVVDKRSKSNERQEPEPKSTSKPCLEDEFFQFGYIQPDLQKIDSCISIPRPSKPLHHSLDSQSSLKPTESETKSESETLQKLHYYYSKLSTNENKGSPSLLNKRNTEEVLLPLKQAFIPSTDYSERTRGPRDKHDEESESLEPRDSTSDIETDETHTQGDLCLCNGSLGLCLCESSADLSRETDLSEKVFQQSSGSIVESQSNQLSTVQSQVEINTPVTRKIKENPLAQYKNAISQKNEIKRPAASSRSPQSEIELETMSQMEEMETPQQKAISRVYGSEPSPYYLAESSQYIFESSSSLCPCCRGTGKRRKALQYFADSAESPIANTSGYSGRKPAKFSGDNFQKKNKNELEKDGLKISSYQSGKAKSYVYGNSMQKDEKHASIRKEESEQDSMQSQSKGTRKNSIPRSYYPNVKSLQSYKEVKPASEIGKELPKRGTNTSIPAADSYILRKRLQTRRGLTTDESALMTYIPSDLLSLRKKKLEPLRGKIPRGACQCQRKEDNSRKQINRPQSQQSASSTKYSSSERGKPNMEKTVNSQAASRYRQQRINSKEISKEPVKYTKCSCSSALSSSYLALDEKPWRPFQRNNSSVRQESRFANRELPKKYGKNYEVERNLLIEGRQLQEALPKNKHAMQYKQQEKRTPDEASSKHAKNRQKMTTNTHKGAASPVRYPTCACKLTLNTANNDAEDKWLQEHQKKKTSKGQDQMSQSRAKTIDRRVPTSSRQYQQFTKMKSDSVLKNTLPDRSNLESTKRSNRINNDRRLKSGELKKGLSQSVEQNELEEQQPIQLSELLLAHKIDQQTPDEQSEKDSELENAASSRNSFQQRQKEELETPEASEEDYFFKKKVSEAVLSRQAQQDEEKQNNATQEQMTSLDKLFENIILDKIVSRQIEWDDLKNQTPSKHDQHFEMNDNEWEKDNETRPGMLQEQKEPDNLTLQGSKKLENSFENMILERIISQQMKGSKIRLVRKISTQYQRTEQKPDNKQLLESAVPSNRVSKCSDNQLPQSELESRKPHKQQKKQNVEPGTIVSDKSVFEEKQQNEVDHRQSSRIMQRYDELRSDNTRDAKKKSVSEMILVYQSLQESPVMIKKSLSNKKPL